VRLNVQFTNRAGADEAGSGAGVNRAFLQDLVKTAFDPSRGLFKSTTSSFLYPNPHANDVIPNSRDHFYFLGRLLGKVIYEGMLVELPLAGFFLCKLLLRHQRGDVDINYLRSLDSDYYKNLMYLRSCDDVSSLHINFVVTEQVLGETRFIELFEGGSQVAVTNENFHRYLHLVSDYKLNKQLSMASDAFRDGLQNVVPLGWLRLFDANELQTLICGAQILIDIDDLKANTVYTGC